MQPGSTKSLPPTRPWLRLFVAGCLSAGLYFLLFTHQKEVIAMASTGRWQALVIILITFLFSFTHGQFTSDFWEVLGIHANKPTPPKNQKTTATASR